MINVVPLPFSVSKQIVPPCLSTTTEWAMQAPGRSFSDSFRREETGQTHARALARGMPVPVCREYEFCPITTRFVLIVISAFGSVSPVAARCRQLRGPHLTTIFRNRLVNLARQALNQRQTRIEFR